jgi:ribosome-associated protein
MMDITPTISIPDEEIIITFIRSSGPGGQNVNKVATAVQLRFDVRGTGSLLEPVKGRLIHLAGKRMNHDGILVIESKRYRSQERNRNEALERLGGLIQRALVARTRRISTKPSSGSNERRLKTKTRQGQVKKSRGKLQDFSE